MKLDFCAACGSKEDLHQHHIVPIVVSGKKRVRVTEFDEDTITLCSFHHHSIHEMRINRQDKHNYLIKKGIELARQKGQVLGRPSSLTEQLIITIAEKHLNGQGVRSICRELQIGPGTFYKAVERYQELQDKKEEANHILIKTLEKFSQKNGETNGNIL